MKARCLTIRFKRIWRDPKRYLEILRRFNGVILPGFSVYRDMPFVMQLWNIYRSRAIGCWLQRNGVKASVNIRYGDRRTYRCCCDGISEGCTIAVGSYGTLKQADDGRLIAEGLDVMVKRLKPQTIVVYGRAPEDIFGKYRTHGITIAQFDSSIAVSHDEAVR